MSFWPDLQAAHDLYNSIAQTLQERESEGVEKVYTEHLPAEVLEAGIKSGRYIQVSASHSCYLNQISFLVVAYGGYIPTHSFPLQGILSVNKHRAKNEAFVRYEGSASKNTGCYQHTYISCSNLTYY